MPANPTSNSPQCNPPGVTLTRVGTPPAGVTWYWQTAAGGTSTANSAATFVATTSGTYHLRAQNDTTGCWSAGSGSLAITITPSLSAVAGTPAPTNAATGICYAGGSTLTDLTWNAVAGATSYDVYFGAGSLPGTAIANVATNSYTLGTLNANTTYYWQVVPRNACGATSGTPATWTFTTSNAPCVCVPTATTDDNTGIRNVTFNTINNTTTGAAAYTNTGISTTVTGTNIYPLSVSVNTGGAYTVNVKAWIDWDNNGLFTDPGEEYNLGSATNGNPILSSLSPLNISIPNIVGSFKMRVRATYNTAPTPCNNQNYSEAEDYTIVVTAPPACTGTPTAGAVTVTPASGIAGSTYAVTASGFTPASGLTYQWQSNTSGAGWVNVGVATSSYVALTGLTAPASGTVIQYQLIITCTTSGLSGTSLSGSFASLSTPYCEPTSEEPSYVYIDDIRFEGTLNDVSNMNSGYTTGYQNFTTLPKAIQAQGEGINVFYFNESYTGGAQVKAWVDWNRDGDFTDAGELVYYTDGVSTSSATFGFVIPITTTPGDYRIRIRNNISYDYTIPDVFTYNFNPCEDFDYTFSEYYDGEAEDYLFTVVAACNANIVTAPNGERCGTGTVNLTVTGTASTTGYNWYTVETGGFPINPSPTGATWTTPSLSTTTTYWVTAVNGTCESLKRTKIVAEINATPVVTFTPSAPVVCGDNDIIQLTAGGDVETVTLVNENFEGGGLGVFTGVNSTPNGAPYDAITIWQNETSPYIPLDTEVWSPAISSGLAGNRFVMSTSNVNPPPTGTVRQFLELTSAVNATNMTGLTLTFDMFYSVFGDEVRVQVNDGSGWTTVQTYTASVGIGTRFAPQTINLTAYNNTPSLRFRIQFWSVWGDGIAVDNIKLFGERPLNTAFNYDTATVDAFTNISCAPGTEYTPGTPATTIYIKPTLTQLENATFTIPVSATLSSGCAATGSVVVTNNTKIFKAGTAGTDWNLGSNWSPAGVPTANNCVVIFDNDVNITGTNYTGYGLNLTVKPSGNLNIASSNSSIITDIVNVEAGGVLEIENDASLVQINNVTNTGNIVYKRTAPSIRGFDYVYWSSPVVNQNIGTIYTSPVSGLKYQWNPTIANGNGGQGNWETASGNMVRAKGYIVRGSSNYGMSATNIDATFTGVPHNGNIPFTISRGSYTGVPYNGTNGVQITNINDNYNLLGNPYPSAIDAQEFLATNTYHATTNPSGVIYGNVKLWTHGYQPAAIVNPFYGTFTYNYNANDYVTLNYLGASDPIGASNIIKSGQAFLVQMIDGTAGSGTINFSNGMRLDASNNSYNNSGFFRTSTNEFEKHRIWLDLIDANNIASGTLVGYATDATYGFDTFFDAQAAVPGFMKIYSLIGNDVYDIQGRSLPFDQNDQVPLGATFVQAGNYTIALNTIDGIFLDSTQNIFLEDKLTNNIHNLKTTPYSFTASVGTFHDRFVLRYTNTVLGNENFENNNNVTVFTNANININSSVETIRSVQIFDLLGRDIAKFDNINNRSFTIQNVKPTQSALLVKVTLENGYTNTYKVIY